MRSSIDFSHPELFNIQTSAPVSDALQQAEKSYLRAEAITKTYSKTEMLLHIVYQTHMCRRYDCPRCSYAISQVLGDAHTSHNMH